MIGKVSRSNSNLNWKRFTVEASEDLQTGILAGIDSTTGLLVPANSGVGAIVMPTTVIYGETLAKSTDAIAIEGKTVTYLKEGDTQETVTKALIAMPLGTFTLAQVAAKAPVFLGVDGEYTLTEPTTTGDLRLVVGYVYSFDLIAIDLEKDIEGTIVA